MCQTPLLRINTLHASGLLDLTRLELKKKKEKKRKRKKKVVVCSLMIIFFFFLQSHSDSLLGITLQFTNVFYFGEMLFLSTFLF